MGIKVAKFGGSSVADAIQIGKTKRLSRRIRIGNILLYPLRENGLTETRRLQICCIFAKRILSTICRTSSCTRWCVTATK